jgi:hypothetical protein
MNTKAYVVALPEEVPPVVLLVVSHLLEEELLEGGLLVAGLSVGHSSIQSVVECVKWYSIADLASRCDGLCKYLQNL